MLNSCLFAVQLSDEALLPALERRVEEMARFYNPLGTPAVSLRWAASARVLVGTIRFDGESRDARAPLVWGAPLPAVLGTAEALIGARDADLRALDHSIAAVAALEDRACVVSGAAGATALYTARSVEAESWSSHAVAAAWLASGRVELDASAIPEFIAAQLLGGDRTFLRGVVAVPPATRVSLDPGGARSHCFWPVAERWETVSERDAQDHAEGALMESLARRLGGREDVWCGLTAGLDSRVAAIALKEVGVPFRTFTWHGLTGAGDETPTAARVALELGVDHELRPFERYTDEETLTRISANVRWSEGLMPMGFAEPTRPPAARAFVTGEGGETARAYYYLHSPPAHPRPSERALAGIVFDTLRPGLVGARREVVRAVRGRVGEWVAEARRAGHREWRLLDVLYAEQVLGRWGRAMLPQSQAEVLGAFTAPEVARALSALPLEDRLSDGFHRRFLDRRAPALAAGPPARPNPRPIPPALRRLRRRWRRATQRRPAGPWELAPEFADRPRYREWIADEVLTAPFLEEVLGASWVRDVREGFARDRHDGLERASWVAGPVALDAALRELGRAPAAAPVVVGRS